MTRQDLGVLAGWLAEPHVAQWWREPSSVEEVEAAYGPVIDGDPATELFVVELDGEPVGMIQRTWLEREPAWAAALAVESDFDIDFLIGRSDLTGRGLGPVMLAEFVDWSFRHHRQARAVSSAPQQDNVRSWRALEKAGFSRVRAVPDLGTGDPSDHGPAYVYLLRRSP